MKKSNRFYNDGLQRLQSICNI